MAATRPAIHRSAQFGQLSSGLPFRGATSRTASSDRAELAFEITFAAEPEVPLDGYFEVGCLEFNPVGIVREPQCLGAIGGMRGRVTALGQDQADAIDDFCPRSHWRDGFGSPLGPEETDQCGGHAQDKRKRYLDLLSICDVELRAQRVAHLYARRKAYLVPRQAPGQSGTARHDRKPETTDSGLTT